MALPWNRTTGTEQTAPAEGRRRSRGRRARRRDARAESTPVRLSREARHQRAAFAIGIFLLLVVFGVVSFGYYQEFFRPPRVWAGSVRNVEFTMGDLVQRIRVLQGISGRVDLSIVPFEYLSNLLDAEVLRQASPGLGISITDEDIDRALRDQFYPTKPVGQETDPGQLDEEFRNTYQIFLARTGLSEDDFERILEEQLSIGYLRAILSSTIEDTQEHVEVQWIRLDVESGIDSSEVRDRLDNENFAKVASEVSVPGDFANARGYVGWVPKKAFPGLDNLLFGDEEKQEERLGPGETGNPEFNQDGIYIVQVLSEPEQRAISDLMRAKLSLELVKEWQSLQQLQGAEGGWLKMNFNSEYYAWVADQVHLSASRADLGQGGQRGR